MSVVLPSDLIKDVANAADPAKVRAARERLMSGAPLEIDRPSRRVFSMQGLGGTFANEHVRKSESDPLVKFEAMVLQNFVEAMLPKDAESVFGKGLSGDMWQSMMAEKISLQVAQAGGIGIAGRLLNDYVIDNEKRLSLHGLTDVGEAVLNDRPNALAKAMQQKAQLDLVRRREDGSEQTTSLERTS